MLINCDVKGLEVVCAAYLSQDSVLCKEIINGVDLHEDNRARFNLPSRLIAKVFGFRLIYGGTAYAYSVDPDFAEVGYSEKKWQGVIDEYYRKYQGLHKWHTMLMQEATTTGRVVSPTGRIYPFSPTRRSGDLVWPRPTILNYPVQGLGADLLCLARTRAVRLFRDNQIEGKLISTVHDSIVADTRREYVPNAARLLGKAVSEVPVMFEKLWKKPFNLPMTSEIEVGMNLGDMESLTEL